MKTREMALGEEQAIEKLRKDGKSIRSTAQTLAITRTTIWNFLSTDGLIHRHRTGRPRYTSAVDGWNILRGLKKNPKVNQPQLKEGRNGGTTIYCLQDMSGTKIQRLHKKIKTYL